MVQHTLTLHSSCTEYITCSPFTVIHWIHHCSPFTIMHWIHHCSPFTIMHWIHHLNSLNTSLSFFTLTKHNMQSPFTHHALIRYNTHSPFTHHAMNTSHAHPSLSFTEYITVHPSLSCTEYITCSPFTVIHWIHHMLPRHYHFSKASVELFYCDW